MWYQWWKCRHKHKCGWIFPGRNPRNEIKRNAHLASSAPVLIHSLSLPLSQVVNDCLLGLNSDFASKESVPCVTFARTNWACHPQALSPYVSSTGCPGEEEVLSGWWVFLGMAFRTNPGQGGWLPFLLKEWSWKIAFWGWRAETWLDNYSSVSFLQSNTSKVPMAELEITLDKLKCLDEDRCSSSETPAMVEIMFLFYLVGWHLFFPWETQLEKKQSWSNLVMLEERKGTLILLKWQCFYCFIMLWVKWLWCDHHHLGSQPHT